MSPNPIPFPIRLLIAIPAVLIATTASCADASDSRPETDDRGDGGGIASRPHRKVLVSAAASLTDAFAEIERAFEAAYPTVDVTLNLAGSSTLRAQILEGAPVDVFASADRTNMARVAEAGDLAGQPTIFARNRLQIAVPPGNPAGVTGLADFARDELLVGLCAEGVPCGDLAREALSRAGVVFVVDTHEPDVRALLTKVELGELDAAVTYVTDLTTAAGRAEGVDIPLDQNVSTGYPIAVLAGAPDPDAARAFVELVLSTDGQAILARHGFGSP
jgi:molybdate transport system substrate-binding protein